MIHMKTVVIPEKTEQQIDHVICDLCGFRIIENNRFDISKVDVSLSKGVCYPEESYGQTTEFDICGSCFESKLIPWLAAQGAKPRVESWD